MSAFEAEMDLDMKPLQRALERFSAYSRRGTQTVMQEVGRNFVRRAVAITPPSTGKANGRSKTVGEEAVESDLRAIFSPLDTREWRAFLDDVGGLRIVPTYKANRRGASVTDQTLFLGKSQMGAFHESRRLANGRVRAVDKDNLIGRKRSDIAEIGFVTLPAFNWFLRQKKQDVGILAAGWNAGGEKLGYKAPLWIRRHGSANGACSVDLAGEVLRIVIQNEVRFGRNVKDLQRTIQTALNQQAEALNRRTEFFVEKAARASGLL